MRPNRRFSHPYVGIFVFYVLKEHITEINEVHPFHCSSLFRKSNKYSYLNSTHYRSSLYSLDDGCLGLLCISQNLEDFVKSCQFICLKSNSKARFFFSDDISFFTMFYKAQTLPFCLLFQKRRTRSPSPG